MDLQEALGTILNSKAGPLAMDMMARLMFIDGIRRPLLSLGGKLVDRYIGAADKANCIPERITREKQLSVRAAVRSLNQGIERDHLTPHLIRVISQLWGNALCSSAESKPAIKRFKEQYGVEPPWLITISPGHSCNLRCKGCYSASDGMPSKLPWSTVDRIITDAKELWGIFLVVFTGGEPLAYHSEGKDIADLMEKHDDLLFLVFTNGTLLDDEW